MTIDAVNCTDISSANAAVRLHKDLVPADGTVSLGSVEKPWASVCAANAQFDNLALPDTLVADLTGDVTGNVTGDLTGNVTGDLTGNVTGDVTGDLTGNVTGDVTGNVTGDLTGQVTVSSATCTGPVSFDTLAPSPLLEFTDYLNPEYGDPLIIMTGSASSSAASTIITQGSKIRTANPITNVQQAITFSGRFYFDSVFTDYYTLIGLYNVDTQATQNDSYLRIEVNQGKFRVLAERFNYTSTNIIVGWNCFQCTLDAAGIVGEMRLNGQDVKGGTQFPGAAYDMTVGGPGAHVVFNCVDPVAVSDLTMKDIRFYFGIELSVAELDVLEQGGEPFQPVSLVTAANDAAAASAGVALYQLYLNGNVLQVRIV